MNGRGIVTLQATLHLVRRVDPNEAPPGRGGRPPAAPATEVAHGSLELCPAIFRARGRSAGALKRKPALCASWAGECLIPG